jgi:hypothetical protein
LGLLRDYQLALGSGVQPVIALGAAEGGCYRVGLQRLSEVPQGCNAGQGSERAWHIECDTTHNRPPTVHVNRLVQVPSQGYGQVSRSVVVIGLFVTVSVGLHQWVLHNNTAVQEVIRKSRRTNMRCHRRAAGSSPKIFSNPRLEPAGTDHSRVSPRITEPRCPPSPAAGLFAFSHGSGA